MTLTYKQITKKSNKLGKGDNSSLSYEKFMKEDYFLVSLQTYIFLISFSLIAVMYEKFKDTKGVIRSHKLKNDRQYNNLQNTTQKLKTEQHGSH